MKNVLEVKRLQKNYGETEVVKGINFTIQKGGIIGLLGPNGAGKTTTVKMITGICKISKGDILYCDKKVSTSDSNYLKEIGVVPQEIAVYDDLSAYDNVDYFCSLYGIVRKERKILVEKALNYVGLWERRKDKPSKFSGGMKRRLNIACSIAHNPKLLIMDEPTVGIDPQSRNHIMDTIKNLNKEGATVIYISHYMEEIEQLCDRVILMDHGVVLEDMGKNQLKEKYKEEHIQTLEDVFLHLTGTNLRDEE